MVTLSWCAAIILISIVFFYHRASLLIWSTSFALLLAVATQIHGFTPGVIIGLCIFLLIFVPLLIKPIRRQLLSKRLLNFYLSVMPSMSDTEKEAISAGTITWEGDLFRGNPNWQKLLGFKKPTLTTEEQAFIDGPLATLCRMIDDWDITHNRADLPPHVWQYIKEQGFLALIIPKEYGGKEFSAYAHSEILVQLCGRSVTVSSTVAVPNSLGPAELLLHYGTQAQKDYYLPRLAKGKEIPCFALTSSEAGSDAGAMSDHGIVCYGEFEGQQTLGIRLNFNKRYITLAPIATVVGLAFKLYDPDHLIGNKVEIGITCALIPRQTPGIAIGRRHFPLNNPFQNGPIHGKDVFIPIDWIIGGVEKAGKGWIMLMECLAAGRAISLPATAIGGAKVSAYASGAYARIRKQFNISIGRFEGIEEPLARIGANTYMMDATRTLAAGSIDAGEKPAVASAIVKYHTTEMGRHVAIDCMDIHGGKGICLGPNNYIGRGFEASPIAITVEGANILTRNMIIFGQGAMRCHPYVLPELLSANLPNREQALIGFDHAVMKHIAFGISNTIRSVILGLTGGLLVSAPSGPAKRYYQYLTRFSSAFALIVDVSMLSLGGNLKRKESISARLGDILSYLYILSATLKKFNEEGENNEDLPLINYSAQFCLYQIQERFNEILRNFPNRPLAWMLRVLIFPLGQHFKKPKDYLNHQIAQLMMTPGEARNRLCSSAFLAPVKENLMADLEDALVKTIAAEPIEKKIKTAHHDGIINGYTTLEIVQSALAKQIITEEEFDFYLQAEDARNKIIAVDDFTNEELARITSVDKLHNLYMENNGTLG